MSKRGLCFISLVVLLIPVTARSAETAKAFFRYLEIPLDESRNTGELLKELSDGENLPEAAVEFSTVSLVPVGHEDVGEEVFVQSTEPRSYPVQGVETVGRAGFTISAIALPMPDGKWSLSISVEFGENVPYFESHVREDGTRYSTQRSRLAGFTLEMETILETGTETVIHADVEKREGRSVCHVVTAAIYPQGPE